MTFTCELIIIKIQVEIKLHTEGLVKYCPREEKKMSQCTQTAARQFFYFKRGDFLELPKKPRIKDEKALRTARKKFCQVCGKYQEKGIHRHHIKSKGSGGDDVKENFVDLCFECHTKVHSGELILEDIVEKELPGLEVVLQIFVNHKEQEENSKWEQAAALVVLHMGLKLKIGDISAEIGMSPAIIREMIRTFNAFPEEGTRVLELGFTHHRLASRADNPETWINAAADNGWSTRQLDEEMKKAGLSKKARRDTEKSKAEKALRTVKEVIGSGTEVSDWLYSELEKIIKPDIAKAS